MGVDEILLPGHAARRDRRSGPDHGRRARGALSGWRAGASRRATTTPTRPRRTRRYWFPERETMDPGERDARDPRAPARGLRLRARALAVLPRASGATSTRAPTCGTLEDFERAAGHHARTSCAPPRPSTRRSATTLRRARATSCASTAPAARPGRPTAFGIGRDDWRAIANAHARIMWGMGIRPGDTVFIGSVFSLYMGSWATLVRRRAPRRRRVPVRRRRRRAEPRAVNWMAQMKPAAFYGTPSYALHLAEIAAEEGLDPRDFGIRILFFSGEPGRLDPGIRARIEELYGGKVFDCGSMAEMTPWMNLGGVQRPGRACCAGRTSSTRRSATPQTDRRRAVRPEGTPVYTHLERTSPADDPPAVRRPHALGGRPEPVRAHVSDRLPQGIYGRIDDMFTIRGENVYPSGDRRGPLRHERLRRRAPHPRQPRGDDGQARRARRASPAAIRGRRRVQGAARRRRCAPRSASRRAVVAVPPNTFERTEFKARRVIDERAALPRDRAAPDAKRRGAHRARPRRPRAVDRPPDHAGWSRAAARATRSCAASHAEGGGARTSIGITGAPGSGKSDARRPRWRASCAQRDKTRRHRRGRPVELDHRRRDPRRPHPHAASTRWTRACSCARMATRGALGGLVAGDARRRRPCSTPRGRDVVIIETVGVGQDEVDVVRPPTRSRSSPCPAWATTSRRSRRACSRSPTCTSSTRPTGPTPTARSPS